MADGDVDTRSTWLNHIMQKGALIRRQELPYVDFYSLGALNEVPYCISDPVEDLVNVFVVLSFGALS